MKEKIKGKPFHLVEEVEKIIKKNKLDGKKQNDMGVLLSKLADRFKSKGYLQVHKDLKELSERYIYVSFPENNK